jgi:Fe-S cluster assembly protein SufD
MNENFKISPSEINKIKVLNQKDKNFRLENLKLFNQQGFPTRNHEDWKFSDINQIFSKNFKNLESFKNEIKPKSINFIKEFDHNHILMVNGKLENSEFKFEDKNKIKIKSYNDSNFSLNNEENSLINLNNALSNNGLFLEVADNYRFEKAIIIYNVFTDDLKDNLLNNKNKIILGKNSELHIVEYNINQSKNKFIYNTTENVILNENASLKTINLQANQNEGFFYKFSKGKMKSNSNYSSFIFSSGPKFNKIDAEFDLEGENCDCNIKSALFINKDKHQEIKTKINHLVPNCKSYQKIKSVVDAEGKGVYQGKIYVKDIAQKTNAYQLSKALLLSENSEFNSKPELEIYADDVKCSHGSTSGNVDENSIHYLMTRGLSKKQAVQLLVNGFLNEIIGDIKSNSVRKFIENKIEIQIHGY